MDTRVRLRKTRFALCSTMILPAPDKAMKAAASPHQHVPELPRIRRIDVFGEQSGPIRQRRPVGVIALHRTEIWPSGFRGSGGSPSRRPRRCRLPDFPAPIPCRPARRMTPACRWRSDTARCGARFLDRELRAVPIGVLAVAVDQHAELVDAVDDLVLIQDVPLRLHLALRAEHLVQRQHRVVGGMIGVVAGRPIDHLLAVAHREIVGDRDRLRCA